MHHGLLVQIDSPFQFGFSLPCIGLAFSKNKHWLKYVRHKRYLNSDLLYFDLQLQGVAYVHDWDVTNFTKEELERVYGGSFFYYDQGENHSPNVRG